MDCFSDFYERLEALTELPEPIEDEDGEPVEEEDLTNDVTVF